MTVKSFDFESIEPYEYRGFVLVPAFAPFGKLASLICKEINFSMYSLDTSPWITYSSVIEMFKKKVDEIMSNKVPTSNPEKELNRLKLLLFMQPTVFYGTNEVSNLLALCEQLLEASKKEEEEDKVRSGYYQELDKVKKKVDISGLSWTTKDLHSTLNDVYLLFYKLLRLTFEDVIRDYFERTTRG